MGKSMFVDRSLIAVRNEKYSFHLKCDTTCDTRKENEYIFSFFLREKDIEA